MLNIVLDDFKRNWYVSYNGNFYTNGSLKGKIHFESQEYIVLKLV